MRGMTWVAAAAACSSAIRFFWINVLTGVAAVGAAVRVLRDSGERIRHRLDLPGMITLGLGLFGLLWAMTKLANAPLDATMVGYLVGGVVFLVVSCC